MRCWDIARGQCVQQSIDTRGIGNTRVTPLYDGTHFVADNRLKNELALWNIETGATVAEFGHAFLEVQDIDHQGAFILYNDIEQENLIANYSSTVPTKLNNVLCNFSTRFMQTKLLFLRNNDTNFDDTYRLLCWKLTVRDTVNSTEYQTTLLFDDFVFSLAMSHNEKLLLTSSGEICSEKKYKVCLWEIAPKGVSSKLWERSFSADSFPIKAALSPDARLSFVFAGNCINVYDNSDGRLMVSVSKDGYSDDFCITPDSKKMLYCKNGVCVWNIEESVHEYTFIGHGRSETRCVAVSPDGLLAASGDCNGLILLWDISDGSVLTTYRGHTGSVSKIVIVPEKGLLVSGAGDGTVRYWDLSSGKELARCYMTRDAMVTVTPDKRYDAPDGKCQHLRWTIDHKSYPLEYLKDRYYTPGLLKSVLDEHSAGLQKEKHDTSWGEPAADEGSTKQPSAKLKILMNKVSKYPQAKKIMLQRFLKESHALKQQPKLTQHQAMLLKELSPHQREVLMKGLAAKKELARRAALKEPAKPESSKAPD